jgi:hypothetical protein
MSKVNLLNVMDQATPWDIELAHESWFRYRRIVGGIAAKHGYSASTGAAVFAALSPNNDYLGNLRDTNRLLASARAGMNLEDFKVSTYGNNKRKAWRIAHGEKPLDLLVFPKTRSFYLNIMNPEDPQPVTVDGHIFNAWTGVRISLASAAQKLRAGFYDAVAEDIRQIGAEQSLIPNVVQGIVWFSWKRMHRILYSRQLEFWSSDYIAAGLGFERESL